MGYENILVSDRGKVRIVTLNRKSPLNPLDMDTLREIKDAILNSGSNVILLHGANRAFSAGADINNFMKLTNDTAGIFAKEGHDIMNAIASYPRPVIAAIHGYCLGGGFELALACDIRVAHPDTTFGLPEVNLGILPGFGGTQRLRHIVGETLAFGLISTGKRYKAGEAFSYGLLNEVSENYLEVAIKLAEELSKKPKESLRLIKHLVRNAPDDIFEEEIDAFGEVFAYPDREEGVKAFLEKREANFRD